ncbi:MAG: polysaccharide biosynthesis protein [Bacteroidaceae bacterium]|nr:polysaccharide biosynthesis protein [Bacteroidaceae bacterium]
MNFISKLSNWYFTSKSLPYWCVLLFDCLVIVVAGYFSAYLQFGGNIFAGHFWGLTLNLLIAVVIFIFFFRLFHTYSGILRFSTFSDLHKVGLSNVCAVVVAHVLFVLLVSPPYDTVPLSGELYYIPFFSSLFVISTILMWAARVLVKNLFETYQSTLMIEKAFIYGVREGAVSLANAIMSSETLRCSVVGFVCPRGETSAKYLLSSPVYQDDADLLSNMRAAGATVFAVSPLMVDVFREQTELIDGLTKAGVRIYVMPDAQKWDGKSKLHRQHFHQVEIEDLLPRDEIQIDMNAIAGQLADKTILITGAAGSIGCELVRQIAGFSPRNLVLVDQAETPMHDMRLWVSRQPGLKAETIVASITNESFMERLFDRCRPEYVFHAAAYKHVPMMEDNPAVAVQNNIRGTRVIADLAVKYGCSKFVLVSTDKAVNPTNVMGCSKRLCEIYCQSLSCEIAEGNVKGVTQFVTTRFGNVLGSSGSVIPIFREQIRNGGPITVTHPDIIRYFMLIPEACKLVLEAAVIGHGGEIFVFDMGKPVRIVELAKRMILLSGAKDVKIEFTGLRDGEKLYEEVLSDKEKVKSTTNSKIFIADVRRYDFKTAAEMERQLYEASFSATAVELVRLMQSFVPEYKTTNPCYVNTND